MVGFCRETACGKAAPCVPYRIGHNHAARIGQQQRVLRHVPVRVYAPNKPNRIALDISADDRIVVSCHVVREPRFGIVILAGQYSNKALPSRETSLQGQGIAGSAMLEEFVYGPELCARVRTRDRQFLSDRRN